MRSFKIPYGKVLPDKVVGGGRFTPKEAIYLGSIFLLIVTLFIMNTSYIDDGFNAVSFVIRLIILIAYAVLALVMAFKKIDIYDLDEYMLLKLKYKYRKYKNTIYEKY